LRDIGVLILVDQNEFEARLILPQDFRLLAEQPDVFQEQVAEVGGIENFQALLIGAVEFQPLAAGEHAGLARRHLVGRQPAILPAVDQRSEHARRPALLVDLLGFEELLEQPDLVVDVENGEVGLEPYQLRMPAQDLHPDRMEGAEPGHALDHMTDDLADAPLHLARRLVGEGHRQNLARARAAGGENVGDAYGEHPRLAGAGAGEHQYWAVERLHRQPLFRVEPGEIAGRARSGGLRARGNTAGGGSRRLDRTERLLQRVGQVSPPAAKFP
jgi:hypothetical protein